LGETSLLMLIIAGFLALAIFSLTAMLVMYRREKDRQEARSLEKIISEFDEALNGTLAEINKLGAVVQDDIKEKLTEIEEKYNAVLFLYNLIDEKQKEIDSALADSVVMTSNVVPPAPVQAAIPELPVQIAIPELVSITEEIEEVEVRETPDPVFLNPKHKEIWNLRKEGLSVSDIARSLSLGQGEVKLILDLAGR